MAGTLAHCTRVNTVTNPRGSQHFTKHVISSFNLQHTRHKHKQSVLRTNNNPRCVGGLFHRPEPTAPTAPSGAQEPRAFGAKTTHAQQLSLCFAKQTKPETPFSLMAFLFPHAQKNTAAVSLRWRVRFVGPTHRRLVTPLTGSAIANWLALRLERKSNKHSHKVNVYEHMRKYWLCSICPPRSTQAFSHQMFVRFWLHVRTDQQEPLTPQTRAEPRKRSLMFATRELTCVLTFFSFPSFREKGSSLLFRASKIFRPIYFGWGGGRG